MTRRSKFKDPKTVLVFNASRYLVAVYKSVNYASRMTYLPSQSISHCCLGAHISCGGYYFRHVDPTIEMDFSDIDNLKLDEYDRLCGVVRRYHSPKEMNRRRIMAKKQFKEKQTITE